ncbi:cell division protein FtsQ/DivIB [Lactiplantibacillus sp. WILCCON 0030]|uniref:Cell division protein DivIB n=1 Tax=Lactiplantibacillus brownii TaxID=3069269 RepID=A0ABU1A9M5_9LACO|nr:cell division protein FtsQ/DivIB [Lactiplantibacillus brownii]MDQ7937629.1 cell division protein FtsQ/DivIB [Lactiplantibacillus brownii]
MALFKRRPKRKAQLDQLTPWERFQRQANENQQAERKRHFSWSGKRIRIGDKLPKLKTQRRRLVTRRAGLLIALFLLGIAGASYFISPLSHIAQVKVTGTDKLTVAQVQSATQIKTGKSVWAVIGQDQTTSRVANKANPQIGQVKTTLSNWNHVTLKVNEIRLAGYLVTGGQYRRVLENGLIMSKPQSQPGGGYPIYASFKSGPRLQKMIAQYAKLPAVVKHNISEIKFSPNRANPERVHLYMNDGNEVYATISTFTSKMRYYSGIAAKMKTNGVINLEVGAYSYSFKKSSK